MAFINKEELLKQAQEKQKGVFAAPVIVNLIEKAPEVDVVEVKHGRWIEREESLSQKSETIAQCSVCGEGWLVESAFPFESCVSRLKHCPNCGAKMDLKEGATE